MGGYGLEISEHTSAMHHSAVLINVIMWKKLANKYEVYVHTDYTIKYILYRDVVGQDRAGWQSAIPW